MRLCKESDVCEDPGQHNAFPVHTHDVLPMKSALSFLLVPKQSSFSHFTTYLTFLSSITPFLVSRLTHKCTDTCKCTNTHTILNMVLQVRKNLMDISKVDEIVLKGIHLLYCKPPPTSCFHGVVSCSREKSPRLLFCPAFPV